MIRQKFTLWISLVLVALFCFGTPPAMSADSPRHGGSMTYLSGRIPTLNPLHGQVNVGYVSTQIFACLTRLDENNKASPYLAKSWTISDDGLIYEFKLHENAVFHDGKPITSSDVAFSLEMVLKHHRFGLPMFGPIEKMETPDEHTLVVKLSRPHPPFLVAATSPRHLPIMPKHIYDDGQEFMTHPAHRNPVVGSGPFKIRDMSIEEYIHLERHNEHFFKDLPYLDEIILRVVIDKTAMRVGLTRNQFQLARVAMVMRYAEIESFKRIPHLQLIPVPSPDGAIGALELNHRTEPFNNKKVRQAITYAIDRSHIANVLHYGYTKPAAGAFPQTNIFFNDKLEGFPYDVEKANRLLDEAGYLRDKNGTRFNFRITFIAPPHEPDFQVVLAEFIADSLKEVGINVVLEPMPGAAAWSQRMADWNYEGSLIIAGDKVDPAVGIDRLYRCDNIQHQAYTNTSGYCNPKLDKLFDLAAAEQDEDKRRVMYYEIQDKLLDEAPMVWLITRSPMFFTHENLFFPNWGTGEFWDEVYWKE